MNPTAMNPIHAIISLVSEKASTLPILPFDVVVKVTYHYIQENPEKILDSYHYIQKHISKKEKQTLIVKCFEEIYKKSINELYDRYNDFEWEYKRETKKEKIEREKRNEEKENSTSLIDLVIYKSRKNKQILKNFSSMIFDIQDLLLEEKILKTVFSGNPFDILSFERHNLFSLDLLKILYASKEKNIWVFLKSCTASNIEILEFLFQTNSLKEILDSECYFYELFKFAEKMEDFDMLEWLLSKGMVLNEYFYINSSSLKCFEWLYSKNCEWSSTIDLKDEVLIAFAREKGLNFGEKIIWEQQFVNTQIAADFVW